MADELVIPASPNWYCSSAAASNDSGLYAFAARNQIYVYDVTGDAPAFKKSFQHRKDRVTSLCWISCEKTGRSCIGSGSEDGFVYIIDINSDKTVIAEQKSHNAKISSVVSPVNDTIITVNQDHVKIEAVLLGDEKGLLVTWNFATNDSSVWNPSPIAILCMDASKFHQWIIAIGYTNGHVAVLNVKKKEVLQLYKSHLDEVHSVTWQPVSDLINEDGLLLASGSKDKTIRVWNIERENPVLTLNLPVKASGQRGRKKADDMGRVTIWTTLCWQDQSTLISSTMAGGEILVWNIHSKEFKSLTHGHTRIIFNISIDTYAKKMITTSMDRQILLWNSETRNLLGSLPSLGGYVYSITASVLDPYNIIYGVGDNVIRVWNTRDPQQPYETSVLWQGIKSKVTVVICHPSKESVIGFGTDDGHVGIYNIASKKFEVSISYHKKTVYSISWGPNCTENENERTSLDGNHLYSCGGEGLVLIHLMSHLQNKARDMNAIIRKTNSIKEKFPSRTDIEWRKDFKFVAVGNEDGSVDIFSSPKLQRICVVLVHRKIINCMKWHHQFDISHMKTEAAFANWLATGSNDNYVCVTDISPAIDEQNLGQKQIVIKEKFRYFNHHTQRITCLAWSPHSVELLVSSSYDGTVQVWNVNKNEAIANFRGHLGRVHCVEWSLVDPDVIYSGSEDFTLRRWTVSSCEHKLPSDAKKQTSTSNRRSEKAVAKVTMKPASSSELTSDERTELPAMNHLERSQTDATYSNGDSLAARSTTSDVALSNSTAIHSESKPNSLPEEVVKKSSKGEAKKKKPKSLFPLSATQNHKQKAASQKECIMLAEHLNKEPDAGLSSNEFEPGKAEYVNLGLFGDRSSAFKMFATEGQSHAMTGNVEQQLHLELWKGNLGGALGICKQKGELNEMVVAMSPMGGFDVWQSTMKAYADQLAAKGDFYAAATYYVAVNKVKEAVEMFKSQNMFREAIALAKVRLSSKNPLLLELYMLWGEKQSAEGCYENAAKCYIAAGDIDAAIKILAKKGDISSAKTAAQVALVHGKVEVAESYLKHCAEALLTDFKWSEASQVIKMMQNPKGFTFLAIVHELIMRSLCGSDSDETLCLSNNVEKHGHFVPLESQLDLPGYHNQGDSLPDVKKMPNRLMEVACEVFQRELGVIPRSDEFQLGDLKLAQSFRPGTTMTANDLKIAMLSMSLEVATGMASLLDVNSYQCLLHWLHTLEITYFTHQFEALGILYKLLLPRDFTTIEFITASVSSGSLSTEEKHKSILLFHNFDGYHKTSLLFQFWWKRFPALIGRVRGVKANLECFPKDISANGASHSRGCHENIDVENLLVFLSGICSSLLLTIFGRTAQLRSKIKTLDHDILEAKIKRQLRQHIISKVGKPKSKKSSMQTEVSSSGDVETNWRSSEKCKDTQECLESENAQESGEQTVGILGNEIAVIDEESLKLMEVKKERLENELQHWLSESTDAPFPDCFENAKVILHMICQCIKSFPQLDQKKKMELMAKDIIDWGSENSLSKEDAIHFERYLKTLTDISP